MTPFKVLDCDASFRPDNVAFIQNGDIWTYKRFTDEINRLAHGFLSVGLRKGDRVALHMRNLPELAVAYFACFRIGAVAAPLNTRLKAAEIEQHLKRLKPALYIGQDDLYYDEVAGIGASVLPTHARYVLGTVRKDSPVSPWSELPAATSDLPELPKLSVDTPAILLATSGTTGVPKYVTHTLETISAAAELCSELSLSHEDIAIVATPMVHASGFFLFVGSLWHGAQIILHERFDADAVVDDIERYRATWFGGLPVMLVEMFESQQRTIRDVTSLKTCAVGGDICPPRVQQQFKAHFGTPLLSLWGSTETIGSLTFGSQPRPVSRISAGAEVRICNQDGAPVPIGEVGELQIRGPNVTIGYWEGPDIIRDATQDGWYRTGDLMRQDENGELWFVSRMKDVIVRGGSKISPAEVESALASHPIVKDVGVAGIPDDLFGQRIVGFVELSSGAGQYGPDDILANARRLIADYKLPERLEIVSHIPRNALGKIDRRALLESLSQRPDAAA
ncbi:MAG: acyl--CoA ligase [Proteobacteria bacterium]|nr:acyl--CoA ligase [Pseudomonadota bacterium]